MQTDKGAAVDQRLGSRQPSLRVFELCVILPTLAAMTFMVIQDPQALKPELLVWIALVAVVELIPVPLWRGLSVSMGFPLLIVVGFLNPPVAAGVTALIGFLDTREFKREVGPLRALFNRCQVALSVMAASAIFHALANVSTSAAPVLVGAAMLASMADYLVNTALVTVAASIYYKQPVMRVARELRVGRLSEFLISYLGLGVLGLALAKLNLQLGFWTVPIIMGPLLLARQMFFRSRALEEAHKELQEREQVLRALSNRMAEERQDERSQIAAYLHDDLAQLLFRLSIQVDLARRYLSNDDLDEVGKSLEQIKETKQETSDRIRALIRDLHRSPLGHAGLAEALQGFIAEAARDHDVRFHTDIAEVELPPPIALLMYHIAREGSMNAIKHAEADNVWVTVSELPDRVELVLRDDGVGFDPDAPAPEGHYGMAMMRERATVGGGSFHLETAPGEGATITVSFPTALLLSGGETGSAPAHPPAPADASPNTPDPESEGAPAARSVPV